MPGPSTSSILGSGEFIDSLIVASLEDQELSALADRDIAVLKSRLLADLASDLEFRKLLKTKLDKIAASLREK